MQELLRPFSNLELIGERVHSRSDLKKFLDSHAVTRGSVTR